MKSCPRKSPLSGYEPAYEPDRWNKKDEIRGSHNCFSYAMNVHDPKQIKACLDAKSCNKVPFHQPGSASGDERFRSDKLKTCSNMVKRILGDNPSIQTISFEETCPVETSKIAIVVDPEEDYHFYRQDTNGFWSHKPGGTKVTNKDTAGHTIYDPQLANRRSQDGSLDYSVFCNYMCVPRLKTLHLRVGGYKGGYKKTRYNKTKVKAKAKKTSGKTRRSARVGSLSHVTN